MHSHLFSLSKHGLCLTTREAAVPVRQELQGAIETNGSVTVTFKGIEAITPSFADELFGVLIDKLGAHEFKKKIAFADAREDTKRLVNLVLNARLHKRPKAA